MNTNTMITSIVVGVTCSVLVALSEPANAGPDLAITHKNSKIETSLGELAVTEYYRGGSMILKRVTPPDKSHNTVYYVIHNGYEVLTYKSGPAGTEFAGAGVIRDMVKPDYTIKMAGDKEGRIQRITIYSPDFKTAYDGFWLRNNELIPWSAEELANWRKMRDPKPKTPKKTKQSDR